MQNSDPHPNTIVAASRFDRRLAQIGFAVGLLLLLACFAVLLGAGTSTASTPAPALSDPPADSR